MRVESEKGKSAEGWGETPLSVQWVWPSEVPYESRHKALQDFVLTLGRAWTEFSVAGHPIEIGHAFQRGPLVDVSKSAGAAGEPMPWLAALVCCSMFDIALHDAYGNLHGAEIYTLYGRDSLTRDLAGYLEPAEASGVRFGNTYPADYLASAPPPTLPAWHLVGGLDPIDETDASGPPPNDGYPVLLRDWIRTDGLTSLKIKLRGTDADWDRERLMRVGSLALEEGVDALSADFNCTVRDPRYVLDVLDAVERDAPEAYRRILYVEQPFPYDLEAFPIDVHEVSARKPLFLDESAHDWTLVKRGVELGWTGVALKTCKTQTGALLALSWAKAHGLPVMVQDLTNPMLAQIPHLALAAHAGTIRGVETNCMQFYPDASAPEARIHPGMYKRRDGQVDLSTLRGPGFGYRVAEINRALPSPAGQFGT